MKKSFLFSLLLFIVCSVFANVRMPKIFGDNMVLQRNIPIPVWGWANAGERITVTFNEQTKSVKTGKDGKWMIRLDPESAGGPFQLIVSGKNVVAFVNVLVGEVWVCSGQSNMEMPIQGWGKVHNYQQEIANAEYPQIRHIKVPNTVSSTPKDDIDKGEWQICSSQTAGDFTATGYFFARELNMKN